MQLKHWFLIGFAALAFYVVSFGPGLFLAVRMDKAKVLPPAWNASLARWRW